MGCPFPLSSFPFPSFFLSFCLFLCLYRIYLSLLSCKLLGRNSCSSSPSWRSREGAGLCLGAAGGRAGSIGRSPGPASLGSVVFTMDPSNTRSPRLISPADVRKVLLNASPVSSFDATEAIYTSYEGPKGRTAVQQPQKVARAANWTSFPRITPMSGDQAQSRGPAYLIMSAASGKAPPSRISICWASCMTIGRAC